MRFPRGSGILLHPTSLPGPFGSGDFGAGAYHFVDWMVVAGQTLWQMLPVGPIGAGNSPYMSPSAFAGSPLLIDLHELANRGWLTQQDITHNLPFRADRVEYAKVSEFRLGLLRKAAERFFVQGTPADRDEFEAFCESSNTWLEDYALFSALADSYGGRLWTEWDEDIVHRKPQALKKSAKELRSTIQFYKFVQWCFDRQWNNLRKYAHDRKIKIIGDIPIFVSLQSADVWSNPGEYFLDKKGNPTVVAGVPPDYFSKTGQRWGNPLYRWSVMKSDRYTWWVERFRRSLCLYDIVRIDHFRGFAGYWEIPAVEKTAVKGKWIKGPSSDFFRVVEKRLGKLPIIAEDLGVFTPEVVRLRDEFQLPGMKVLQFAFGNGPDHMFLPHRYTENCVVYTGTHDNDTTRGWYDTAHEHERNFLKHYARSNGNEVHWDFIRLALQSVADIVIIPFQDVLGLGTQARMNFPGTSTGNWEWRFTWDLVQPHHAVQLYELTALYGRCPADRLTLAG